MKQKILILLITFSCFGCSSVESIFDGTNLAWSTEQDIESAITPKNFVVSIKEVKSLIDPLQKFGWYIYADSNSYFIAQTQTLIPGFHINSKMAREHGIKINGTSRETYLFIKQSLGSKKYFTFQELKNILKSKT